MRTKKIRRGDDLVIETLINKSLEKYNVTMADIMLLPENKIDGVPWYQYYTFETLEEYKSWKDWCFNFLKTEVTPKFTKNNFNRFWPYFDLMYGLKQSFLTYDNFNDILEVNKDAKL